MILHILLPQNADNNIIQTDCTNRLRPKRRKPSSVISKYIYNLFKFIVFFNPYENLFAKSLVKITFEISKHGLDDNIKMCLNDMDSEDMGWIQVLQDNILWLFCG